jgi:hypothetical protein
MAQDLAIDGPCLEGTEDCQDPYDNTPHLAAIANSFTKTRLTKEGNLEEKSDNVVTSYSSVKDKPCSPHITATAAAATSRQSEVLTDGEVLARAPSSTLDDSAGP